MLKITFLIAAVSVFVSSFGTHSSAANFSSEIPSLELSISPDIYAFDILNWKKGDTADYKLAGGMVKGTLHSQVREETEVGFWVQEDVNLGVFGKQKREILYDKKTGLVLKLISNGKEEAIEDPNNTELIETRSEDVTVPKGKFPSTYEKTKNKKNNNVVETWFNSEIVSMGGMLKTIVPSRVGNITVQLTDFKRQ